jgi:ribosomal protein S18 acetylase RimI-like enzyme
MQIRVAQESDVIGIERLVNSAYRGEFSKKGWTSEADILGGQRTDVEALQANIQCSNSQILLLFDQELVGCVNLTKSDSIYYLGMLTVKPDLQNKSFGKALLSAAEKFVFEKNIRSIEMQVIAIRQELIAWYLRQGYVQTGERRPFPVADPRFGIPKIKDLEFIVLKKNL